MEGFDKFQNALTEHIETNSVKKDSLLGLDKEERTGLLIGSAIAGLVGGKLSKGIGAYGAGVDRIYGQRKQEMDAQLAREKAELGKLSAYANSYSTITEGAGDGMRQQSRVSPFGPPQAGAPYESGAGNNYSAQYDKMYLDVIDAATRDTAGFFDDDARDIASIATRLKRDMQAKYRDDPVTAGKAALDEAKKVLAKLKANKLVPELGVSHRQASPVKESRYKGHEKSVGYDKYKSKNTGMWDG
ncbi:MAG: hypothetical protein ACYTEQ_01440 [Planctomycetota bacterium]|jgi:hypothetical protein